MYTCTLGEFFIPYWPRSCAFSLFQNISQSCCIFLKNKHIYFKEVIVFVYIFVISSEQHWRKLKVVISRIDWGGGGFIIKQNFITED